MLLRSGKVIGDQIQDDQCAICLDVFYLPTKLKPCGHIFCDPCLRNLKPLDVSMNVKCPSCRNEIEDCLSDLELADIETKYSKALKERKDYEKNHTVTLPLPGKPVWYEATSMLLFCIPIDLVNVICLGILLAITLCGFMLSTSPLILLENTYIQMLWDKFQTVLFKMVTLLASIRRIDSYVRWKQAIALVSGCLIALVTYYALFQINKSLAIEKLPKMERFCCKCLLGIEYAAIMYGIHAISRQLMNAAIEAQNDDINA